MQAAIRKVEEYQFEPSFAGIWRKLAGDPYGQWGLLGYKLHLYVRNYIEGTVEARLQFGPMATSTPVTVFVLKRLSSWCGDRAKKYGNLPDEDTWPRYDLAAPGTHGSISTTRPHPRALNAIKANQEKK